MANLDTKTKIIGDMTVTLSKEKGATASAFDRLVAGLKFLGNAVTDPNYGMSSDRPDQGLPGAQPGPDQGLPGGRVERPEQGLPPGNARPDQGLPPANARPDQGLPGAQPGADNTLPSGARPDNTVPGQPGVGNAVPGAKLGEFLQNNADEIARAILKGTACDPASPKK